VTHIDKPEDATVVSSISESERQRWREEAIYLQQQADETYKKFLDLNLRTREDVAERIQNMIILAEQNNNDIRSAWKLREDARLYLEQQNSSLNFLLERAAEAKSKVFAPVEDTSKGKGAKGKKK
jgi:hypothetical protein